MKIHVGRDWKNCTHYWGQHFCTQLKCLLVPFCRFSLAHISFLHFKNKYLDDSRPFTPLLFFIPPTGKCLFKISYIIELVASKTLTGFSVRKMRLAQISVVSTAICSHPWQNTPNTSYSALVCFHTTLSLCNILLHTHPSSHPVSQPASHLSTHLLTIAGAWVGVAWITANVFWWLPWGHVLSLSSDCQPGSSFLLYMVTSGDRMFKKAASVTSLTPQLAAWTRKAGWVSLFSCYFSMWLAGFPASE